MYKKKLPKPFNLQPKHFSLHYIEIFVKLYILIICLFINCKEKSNITYRPYSKILNYIIFDQLKSQTIHDVGMNVYATRLR